VLKNAQNSEKKLNFLLCQLFPLYYRFLTLLTSYLNNIKDFSKNPTGKEPRDLKLEAEVISQKIAVRSDLKKKI
jgi:hypothetical protein